MNIAVIGAGASGLAAAIEAKRIGSYLNVTVFEQLEKACKKILVTGNGRCNFTNKDLSLSHFYGDESFLKAVLSSAYADSENFFKSLGVFSYCEDGRVYPRSQQSATIREALLNESNQLKINIVTDTEITEIKKNKSTYYINNRPFDAVIVAGGGKSNPVQGSNGSCYKFLTDFSHKIIEPYPALCGLTSRDNTLNVLKGVRVEANASLYDGKTLLGEEEGEIQFTEKAVSGIPIMNLSHLVKNKNKLMLHLDLCTEFTKQFLIEHIVSSAEKSPKTTLESLLGGIINIKLGYAVIEKAGIKKETFICKLTTAEIKKIVEILKCFVINISGTRDFNNAQITCGGISTNNFSPDTMMSDISPGLFCCGEILNIHGDCGGYNLHLAWTTGRIAGAGAVNYIKNLKG